MAMVKQPKGLEDLGARSQSGIMLEVIRVVSRFDELLWLNLDGTKIGDLALERNGGAFRLGLRGQPRVEIPSLFSLPLPDFDIQPDGTFSALASPGVHLPQDRAFLFGSGPWSIQSNNARLYGFKSPLPFGHGPTEGLKLDLSDVAVVVPGSGQPFSVALPDMLRLQARS